MGRFLFICLVMMLPLRSAAEPVVVFAAASLKGALDEIFEGQNVVVSYGGSGAMAQQIARGAPADVFLSANVAWVDWLAAQDLGAERIDLLSNRLIVIANLDMPGVTSGGQEGSEERAAIGIGQTASVPVGIYARQSLEASGDWGSVAERLVEFPSSPAIARAVVLGELPIGIVYQTDIVGLDPGSVAVLELELNPPEPILYPMLLLDPAAEPVFEHLQSEAAAEIFRAHGFIVLADQ